MPETHDKDRARRLLEASLDQADETDVKWLGLEQEQATMGPKTSAAQDVPFTSMMMNMRN